MSARRSRGIIIAQGCAAAAVLLGAVIIPAPGQAVTLVPLGSQPLSEIMALADAKGLRAVALNPASGKLVFTAPDSPALMHLVASGVIPVAAEPSGCGAQQKGNRT